MYNESHHRCTKQNATDIYRNVYFPFEYELATVIFLEYSSRFLTFVVIKLYNNLISGRVINLALDLAENNLAHFQLYINLIGMI